MSTYNTLRAFFCSYLCTLINLLNAVYLYLNLHSYLHLCLYICIYICIYVYSYIYIYIYTLSAQWVTQQRPLPSKPHVTAETSRSRRSSPIGHGRPRDQNTIMAASAAVRSSMGLTLRLSRVIPDCSTCPLSRLKSCAGPAAPLLRGGSSDSYRTINRHLQTSMGEWRCLLTALASITE